MDGAKFLHFSQSEGIMGSDENWLKQQKQCTKTEQVLGAGLLRKVNTISKTGTRSRVANLNSFYDLQDKSNRATPEAIRSSRH